jgi:hypothetical protein
MIKQREYYGKFKERSPSEAGNSNDAAQSQEPLKTRRSNANVYDAVAGD